MILSEAGHTVFRYADEIFSLGSELQDVVLGRPVEGRLKLTVGIPDVLPKLVVYRLLKPALSLPEPVQLVSFEGKLEHLLADLASHQLDVVLTESPLAPNSRVRAFSHFLGGCGVSFFATTKLAKRLARGFPHSLNEAPMLLPTQNTSLRRSLVHWFDQIGIRPITVHEFEDSALLKVFGQAGEGVFCSPSAIEDEVCRQYNVKLVGRTNDIQEKFYAVSVERRLKHPAVVAISQAAKNELFLTT